MYQRMRRNLKDLEASVTKRLLAEKRLREKKYAAAKYLKKKVKRMETLAHNKLTVAQKRFVDVFDGDIKASAKAAKISLKQAKVYFSAPRFAHVREAIQTRDQYEQKDVVWDRKQRQEFWTKMARTARKDSDRLRASELLGKSEADFTEKKIISGSVQTSGIEIVLVKASTSVSSNKKDSDKDTQEEENE